MKKGIAWLVMMGILLGLAGCAEKPPAAAPEVQSPTPSAPSAPSPSAQQPKALPEDSSIDRAFARFAAERSELSGDTMFAYLHAKAWYDEFHALYMRMGDEQGFYAPVYIDTLAGAAYEYAENLAGSDGVAAQFAEIGRFYRVLAADYRARLAERGISVEEPVEDELYQYLCDVNYAGYCSKEDVYPIFGYRVEETLDPMPVLAMLPEEDIYFAYSEFGGVLSANGVEYLFPWGHRLTPRGIVPRLALADFDGDGADELAVILYTGSGTGVSVEELHVIELDGEEHFYGIDTHVDAQRVKDLIFHQLSAFYDEAKSRVEIRLGDRMLYADVSEREKEAESGFKGIEMGNIIAFNAENGVLTVEIVITLAGFDRTLGFNSVVLYADVVYAGANQISLSNCVIAGPTD